MASYKNLNAETKDEDRFRDDNSDQVTDLESNNEFSRPPKTTWRFRSLGCFSLILFVLILLAMIISLAVDFLGLLPDASEESQPAPAQATFHNLHESIPSTPSEEELSCGDTRAVAEARGCILDVMANAWIPKLCHDSNAAAEALLPDSKLAHLDAAGSFQFYQDSNHTIPLSYEQLTKLDSLKSYVLKGWHVSHCLYEWRGSVHAINRVMAGESPVWVRSKVIDEEHVNHCNEVLASQIVEPTEWDRTGFGLGDCIRLDVEWEKIRRRKMLRL